MFHIQDNHNKALITFLSINVTFVLKNSMVKKRKIKREFMQWYTVSPKYLISYIFFSPQSITCSGKILTF